MSLTDELRLARLRRLHAKFLDASEKYPGLYHSACRSDQERLRTIMSPSWLTGVAHEEHAKPHAQFWAEALCYGRYARLSYAGFVSPAHVVLIGGSRWIGRYTSSDPDEEELGDRPCWRFEELSQEAVDNLANPTEPPIEIQGPWDEEEHGSNLWLNRLYAICSHAPERWDYDPRSPFAMEPGESFYAIGLPFNVFLASARAIEILLDSEKGLPERTADSETDSEESAAVRLPDNPKVLKLAKKIRSERRSGATMKDIAVDFTDGDEAEAESLLRQVRRYRNLLR